MRWMHLRFGLAGLALLSAGWFMCAPRIFSAQSLDEPGVVAAALRDNPSLHQYRADMEAARARLWEGISAFLPRVTLGGRYNQLDQAQFASEIPAFTAGLPPSLTTDRYYDASLSVKQPVFTWGANYYRFRQGRLDYMQAQEKYRQQCSDAIFQAKTLTYRALLASAGVAIARESWELSQRRLTATQAQEARGKASRYDCSRAEVAMTNDRVAVSRAEKNLQRALSALKNYLHSSEDIAVSGELTFMPQNYTLEGLLETARANNPQLQQAQVALASAHADLAAAQTGYLPGVFAAYTRTYQRPYADHGAAWENHWQVQLGVEWDLFSGLDQIAAWQRSGSRVESAAAGLEAARSALDLDMQSAPLDYEQARDSLQLQAANIALADNNRSIAEEKFSLGMISPLELQDVQLALSQARLNYQQTLYDYAIAVAAIERLQGLPAKESL